MKPSTTPTAHSLLPAAIAAVTEAGHMLRAEFHRPGGPRGHGNHADIDEEVERLLKSRLMALLPCGWKGEETGAVENDTNSCWIVDPNDGTSDFLKGLRGSAISVALLESDRLALGIVYAPTAPDDVGDLIAWAEGGALTRNGIPVERTESSSTSVIALNADAGDYALHNHTAFAGYRLRALPSPAYRLALAAVGEVDAALSFTGGLSPWDIAGGHALLFGARKAMTDRKGRAIDYRNRSFDGGIGGRPELVKALAGRSLGSSSRSPRKPTRPAARAADPVLLSRAQGVLLGQLAGDALGSAVEFKSAATIARLHPDGVRQLTDGGTWNLIAGQPTDDSEMALALARSIVKERGFIAKAVAAAYVSWKTSGPFDIGTTTSTGIAALAAGRKAQSDSEANGALMRVSPIGILAAGNPARAAHLARQDALLTHPSPMCQAASAAYAAAIAAGVAGGGAEAMWQAAHDHCGDDTAAVTLRDVLARARYTLPTDFQHQMGWVVTAFFNAFHWLMRGASLEAAVIWTVNAGGDTDTNAAICGALLGALQGRDVVPLRWRNAILTCRPVEGSGVRHPRPTDYWPDDALDLAEALLTATQ